MSDNRPKNKKVFSFNEVIRGFYGQFKSNVSYPLAFIQSSIPIKKVDILKSANEVFISRYSDFEELIQRDIDQIRVKEIANKYLKQGNDRVLFFPPLIVACMAIDNGRLIPTYESIDCYDSSDDEELKITWGGDRFQLTLPYDKHSTGYNYVVEEKHYNINPFWAKLDINTDKIKLVVIDGQHRLSALKYLQSRAIQETDVVANIEIPVCILFSPDAISGNNQSETIARDMRELFIRINSTSKQVSGHFLTLLNDKSITSYIIRDFCEKAKEFPIGDGFSLLNLIEWNQRHERKASQVNRAYSITTIQIIADTLREFAFLEDSSALKTKELLNLEKYRTNLDTDEISIEAICEDKFTTTQIEVIKEKMRSEIKISESLIYLFTSSLPYKKLIESFSLAVAKLDKQIEDDTAGASYYKNSVLSQYREAINEKDNKIDADEIVDRSKEFSKEISINFDANYKVYFTNVFQQALIRLWIDLSYEFYPQGISQQQVAIALIPALNTLCFDLSKRLFDNERIYLQKIIFNGSRYIVNKRSKNAWLLLLRSTFNNKIVLDVFISEFNKQNLPSALLQNIRERLGKISTDAINDYYEKLHPLLKKDYEDSWRDKELPPVEAKVLEELSEKIKRNQEGANEEFNNLIESYARKRLSEVKTKLEAVLGI